MERETVRIEMAELGFHYRCIGVRYFQKTLISTAVTPADGYLTFRFITVAVDLAKPLTFSVLLLTKGKLGGFYLIAGKTLMVLLYFKNLAVAERWSIFFSQCQNETQYRKNM